MRSFATQEQRWIEAWSDLCEEVPAQGRCVLPTGETASPADCLGFLQDAAYQGAWICGERELRTFVLRVVTPIVAPRARDGARIEGSVLECVVQFPLHEGR